MNKPQAEGRVNSRLYSRIQEKKVQHSSAIKKQSFFLSTIVSLSIKVYKVNYIKVYHQRSAAKTLVNNNEIRYICVI